MNEQFEPTEAKLRASDPAQSTVAIDEDSLNSVGSRKPSLKVAKRVRRGALATGGAGAAALALTLTLTLGGGQTTPLITLGSGNELNSGLAQQGSATSMAPDRVGAVSELGTTEDAKMMIWQEYNYVAGKSLTSETGRGEIYRVSRTGDPMQILKTLATEFGVAGNPVEDEYSTAEYPSYSIAGDDFYLSIYWSGTGGWSFGKWSNQVWEPCVWEGESGATDESSTGGEAVEPLPICEQPVATPELIPSESELKNEAFALFSSTGYNGTKADVRVQRDEWGAYAYAAYEVAGQKVGIEWSAGWGSDGELSWASGHSVEVTKVDGDFGTISASAAVDRLNAGGWWGGLPSEFYQANMATDAIAYPTGKEGEVVDVEVTAATPALLTVYDATGNVWLVPGYAMTHSLGWVEAVISVEDGVIALPDYSDVMPMEGVKVVD